MKRKRLEALVQRARPYLPGLPEEVRLLPWPEETDPRIVGLASEAKGGIALRPGLRPDEEEQVALHELLHLAEPLLPERWVQVLDGILRHALEQGLPPRDIPSLAWLSLEEALERLNPPPPSDPGFFPGPLGGFYETIGVLPDREAAQDPYYLLVQIEGGLPYTGWALERLWPEPPLTRQGAVREIFRFAREAEEGAWQKVEELLGLDLFPEPAYRVRGVPEDIPQGRLRGVLRLLEAVLPNPEGQGEAYEPPKAGEPEEVVAGLITARRLGKLREK
ncbi:MAG: hypothetical protein ABDH20_13185 [Thermus sp.]